MSKQKKIIKEEVLELLEEYYHYKYMSAGFFISLSRNVGMSFYDFIMWLRTRKEINAEMKGSK